MGTQQYQMVPTAQTMATIRRLQRSDLMPDLRRELGLVTQPVVPAIKRVVEHGPSQTGHTADESLRVAISKGIKRIVRFSSRSVLVAFRAVPHGGLSNLTRVYEGEVSPWQHETYGHQPLVTQEPNPFFYKTCEKYAPVIFARIIQVVETFGKKIE